KKTAYKNRNFHQKTEEKYLDFSSEMQISFHFFTGVLGFVICWFSWDLEVVFPDISCCLVLLNPSTVGFLSLYLAKIQLVYKSRSMDFKAETEFWLSIGMEELADF
ncbi:hypothetical protein A4A49_53768, partial [Nicotiana attenuata]